MNRPYMLYDSGVPILFDGDVARTFIVSMRNAVSSARIRNISPGTLYVFVFHQDAAGGHSFQWPGVVRNSQPIDTRPSTTSVQCFIGNTGGFLEANIPGTAK